MYSERILTRHSDRGGGVREWMTNSYSDTGPAVVALQRPLRCLLLPSDPRVRHREPPGPWRSCSGPARRPPARRCAAISAASSGISARAGHRPASCCAATATMPGPRRWTGARRTASAGSEPLMARLEESAGAVRTRRALEKAEVIRDFAETTHRGKELEPRAPRHCAHRSDPARPRRALCRDQSHPQVPAHRLRQALLCPGQAVNLKGAQGSPRLDRTSCRRPEANQVRLVLHTAAYWLLLTLRDAIPAIRDLAKIEFATIRLRLLKIAVRVQETASRIMAYAARCTEAALVRGLAGAFAIKHQGGWFRAAWARDAGDLWRCWPGSDRNLRERRRKLFGS